MAGCPFFNDKMAEMPSMTHIFKSRYCLGDSFSCARHMVFQELGSDKVPADLFPNQQDRAKDVIAAAV